MRRPIAVYSQLDPTNDHVDGYTVSVEHGGEIVELGPFKNGADAWAAGVDAYCDIIERQSKAAAPAKAVEYAVRLSLEELNALANLVGFHLEPEDGARPIRGETLQRCATRLAQAKKA